MFHNQKVGTADVVDIDASKPSARVPREQSRSQEGQTSKLKSLELFAGAGGLALGVHDAGFECLGMVEWDEFACQTLRDNAKRVLDIDPRLIYCGDVRDSGSIHYKSLEGAVDLLSGGPPCQPFSTAGRSNGRADHRDMFPAFIDIAAQVRPKAILIENVKGLLRDRFSSYVDYLVRMLSFPLEKRTQGESWEDHHRRLKMVTSSSFNLDEQYKVHYQLVDAADYGVPQRRERVFFTAFRGDTGRTPSDLAPTHSRSALLYDQFITGEYWARHRISLRQDHLIKRDLSIIRRMKTSLSPFAPPPERPWVTVRDALSFGKNQLPTPVERGEKPLIANHVQHPGARIYKCHIGSFWDFPAKALKAGTHGTPGGENMLRYSENEGSEAVRYFTTREAARLQTFPDTWTFHGTWGACIKQLGNAVPAELGSIFARAIAASLQSQSLKKQ